MTQTTTPRGPVFCLHPRVVHCPAGLMCPDCGEVIHPEHTPVPAALAALSAAETSSRGPPVTDTLCLSTPSPPDAAAHEWALHTTGLTDQPKEVMDGAFDIFQRTYQQHPVTGPRARALTLMALLWATRRLHGTNSSNERYLLTELHTPTRLMNRAFSTLAAVIQSAPERSCADCSLLMAEWAELPSSLPDAPPVVGVVELAPAVAAFHHHHPQQMVVGGAASVEAVEPLAGPPDAPGSSATPNAS